MANWLEVCKIKDYKLRCREINFKIDSYIATNFHILMTQLSFYFFAKAGSYAIK